MIVTVTDLYDGVTPETSPVTITVIEGSATTGGGGGGAVASVNGHVGTVVLDADDLADGTTNHVFTAADDTKLAGIATGATANDTDANLKARANHTGSQAIATVTGLQAALDGAQPLDADLTAIAALTTTAFGRALLELANAAAGRTALALGTAAVAATGDFDAAGAAAAAQAASQPLDSDLTALAALSTTSYGRSLIEAANASALRTLAGLALGMDIYSKAAVDSGFQPLDSDLTSIAALTTTSTGRSLLAAADAAALRTILGLGTAALISSTAGGDLSGTLPSPTVAKINGVAVTGTPSVGYVPTATGSAAATWQAASSSGGAFSIDTPPTSADAYDLEFDGALSTDPADDGLTWTNQGTSTSTRQSGGRNIAAPSSAASSLRILEKAIPAGTTWTVVAKFTVQGSGSGNIMGGLCLRNSSNGKIASFGLRSVAWVIRGLYWTDPTTYASDITGDIAFNLDSTFYAKIIKNSATSYDLLLSNDGIYWRTVSAAVNIAATTGTLDKLGFHVNPENSAVAGVTCHWLRKTA